MARIDPVTRDAPNTNIRVRASSDSSRFGFEKIRVGSIRIRAHSIYIDSCSSAFDFSQIRVRANSNPSAFEFVIRFGSQLRY